MMDGETHEKYLARMAAQDREYKARREAARVARLARMLGQQTQKEAEEYFRAFIVRRSWLHGGTYSLIDDDAYNSLKARDHKFWRSLTQNQKRYLVGFADGFMAK